MSKKLDKTDVKGPDMFVSTSDRIFAWVEQNARPIAVILLVVALASLAAVGYGYWKDSRELQAANALFGPEAELKNAEEKLRESRAAQMQASAGKKAAKTPAEPDFNKDYAPHVEKMREQIKAHANTKAALVSSLSLTGFLLQQKQFPQALEVLELVKYEPSKGDLLGGFWRMHRGLVFLENQKADEALKEYKAVLESKDLKYFHPEALLKTGVAHELKGDSAKAKEVYERLTREFKDTEASTSAQQYLRLLEMKSQQ